ncbi:MAG: hypothetical protein EHM48_00785 [Planctomycetaceae bacterium]|nr:MAG: hypothetical protein EHM48_00785 [Planctomycetaceae bacterium]
MSTNKPGARSRARLSDKELAFFENTRACACGIIQEVKALTYWIDDPDQLAIALGILEKAQRIRVATLEWERERKVVVMAA